MSEKKQPFSVFNNTYVQLVNKRPQQLAYHADVFMGSEYRLV